MHRRRQSTGHKYKPSSGWLQRAPVNLVFQRLAGSQRNALHRVFRNTHREARFIGEHGIDVAEQ